MLLIGLGHKAQQGKDAFAKVCKDTYGRIYDIRLHSFADPLREEVRNEAVRLFAMRFPAAEFDPAVAMRLLCDACGVGFEENPIVDEDYPWGKQRALHQYWGTEFRRHQDEDYWTKKAEEIIVKAKEQNADAVIFRDLRFFNEYDLIARHHGFRVKIFRPGYLPKIRVHVSETELNDAPFDLQLGFPDGRLDLLRQTANALFPGWVSASR
jgi:hypothetical protein